MKEDQTSCPQKKDRKQRRPESKKRNYTFISVKRKEKFINLFLQKGQSILEAAKSVNLKYSSAKTIVYKFRDRIKAFYKKQQRLQQSLTGKECQYRNIDRKPNQNNPNAPICPKQKFVLVCTIGNKKVMKRRTRKNPQCTNKTTTKV